MTTAEIHPSAWSVLRNRNFALLWYGQLVSTIGDSLMSLAASILVYRLTNSALSVGLMLMATALPSIVLGLFAGVFVDRYDRKRIMISADLVRALLVLLVPFLVSNNIAWLYVIVLLNSCVTQFFEPAHASVIPEIASDEELAAANSMIAISSFGSTAVGFAASGLIASAFSIEWAFYLDAISFLVSALCIARLNLPTIKTEGQTNASTILKNLRSGLQFLTSSPILRSTFIITPFLGISFGLWNSLLLPFSQQALHATEFEYGMQEALTSVGFVVGSLLIARISDWFHEGQWLAMSLLGMALVNAIYASVTSIPIAIVLVMISGFLNAPSAIARQLIVQRNTSRSVRGRVNSVFFVGRDAAFMVGMGAAGLADVVGVRQMAFASALLVAIPGFLALVLPGLARQRLEWERQLHLLKTASPLALPDIGRAANLADLDALVAMLPPMADLTDEERQKLVAHSHVLEAPSGTTIVRGGEQGDCAYFILDGRVVAGHSNGQGGYQVLETLHPGDYFGHVPTPLHQHHMADLVTIEATTLLRAPAGMLRNLLLHSKLVHHARPKFFHLPTHLHLGELPRMTRHNQHYLRELRTPSVQDK